MAARLLQSLSEENPDLQIGCMTGIFQLFDRNQIIASRRVLGPSPKRLLPGNSHFSNGSFEAEFNNTYKRNTGEINLNRNSSERLRISSESSRASFSSSRSSVSSVDYDRAAEPEPSSSDRIIFPETPFDDAVMAQSSSSSGLGRQSFDLRDVVKDSMYREARGLVKSSKKEEVVSHKVKHRDSPRPLQHSKSVNGSYTSENNGRNASLEAKDSGRAIAKLQEAPWHMNEAREYTRPSYEQKDGSLHKNSQDAPRFSYDGRELNRFSFESRETLKSIPKLKELPRLSLDSREGSMLPSSFNSKSNASFKTVRTSSSSANDQVQMQVPKDTPRNQQRPPSVVAKLMGLESLPDSTTAGENHMGLTKTTPLENWDGSRSFTTELSTPVQSSKIPLNSWKDPASPKRRNPDLVMKPLSSSRFPIEPAPWKYMDGSRGPARPASRLVKVPARSSGSFPTVYGEIEKRLKELEFRKSGKDLRALKQILEAIQAKGLLEIEKEEQGSNFESSGDYDPKINPNLNTRSGNHRPRNDHQNAAFREDSATYNSPIVIMKPANLVRQTSSPASSLSPFEGLSRLDKSRAGDYGVSRRNVLNNPLANNQVQKDGCRDHFGSYNDNKNKSRQQATRPQQLPKENNITSTKSSGTISPRLQQKKLEIEKRSRPPTPPSDVLKPRRQSSRQVPESAFSGRKSRAKSANAMQSDDQLSEISNESRNLSNQGDDLSVSDSITTPDLKIDTEDTSGGPSAQINGSHSPSMKAITKQLASITKQDKITPRLSEDSLSKEHALVAPEHPSPVSVLDAPMYREESLSPIKQFPDALDDNGTQNSAGSPCEKQYNRVYDSSPKSGAGLISEMSHKKLQRIDNLVQKLRRLNSTHDESNTDYIASLCENTNPDHRYISEILLASGLLLRDLSSSLTTFQLHSSGHPINPELFFVLEQTKSSAMVSKDEPAKRITNSKSNPEKFHRKLIFDAVNEILVKKLAGASPDPCLKPNKIARKTLNAQKLLKELCSEIEQLQANHKSECTVDDENDGLKTILCEDVMHRSESWTEWNGEIMSGVVLDIERLLFKDLVNEIVIGEAAASLRAKSSRRTRKLFAK